MDNKLIYPDKILSQQISGFRQYFLCAPVHVNYVSRNFCELTGYSEEDILHDSKDLYIQCILPEDRNNYADLINSLAAGECTRSCEYRLIKKDGALIHVRDTAASMMTEDGKLVGQSVLTVIPEIRNGDRNYLQRYVEASDEAESLRDENKQLKESLKDLVMNFSDGIAAFEVTEEGLVKPMYASENVCGFFGYTQDEWLSLTRRFTPLRSFTAGSEASYDEFVTLLRTGEAEFAYYDHKTESERRIRAICPAGTSGSGSSRFVMLYSTDNNGSSETIADTTGNEIRIRTFGYFDVFVGDKPIAFRNKKAKELFALLVDRRGGFVTSQEAIGFLWEDEPTNPVTLARYRKVALRLKNTLEEYGVSDVVESVDGDRRIVMEKVKCDLYDYLTGREEYANLFMGSYMTNYSWAETTLGDLIEYYDV